MSQKEIFRQKSIDRISSPEELNNYLKVTTPGVWALLAAIIVFLIGLIIWSSVGVLETKAEAKIEIEDSVMTVIVSGAKADKIKDGMIVVVEDNESIMEGVSIDEYGRAVGYAVCNLKDGKYNGEVIIERIHPIKFLIK
jgi:hypothetical protein